MCAQVPAVTRYFPAAQATQLVAAGPVHSSQSASQAKQVLVGFNCLPWQTEEASEYICVKQEGPQWLVALSTFPVAQVRHWVSSAPVQVPQCAWHGSQVCVPAFWKYPAGQAVRQVVAPSANMLADATQLLHCVFAEPPVHSAQFAWQAER